MLAPTEAQIQQAYNIARERFAGLGVDTDQALATFETVSIGLHCWQGMTSAVSKAWAQS
jgi:L-rhamnose isomerase